MVNITPATIEFTIAENNTFDKRTAVVELKYPRLKSPVRLSVTQSAPQGNTFSFDIKDITTTSCTGIINVSDDTMPYIAILTDIEYLTVNNILTEEALIKDDYDYFLSAAAQNDMVLKDYIASYVAMEGYTEIPWKNMTPASKYVLYAYGIQYTTTGYKQVTPVQHMIIENPLPELTDATFDIDITVNGTNVSFDMTPHNWDGYYCLDFYASTSQSYIAEGVEVDDAYTRRISRNWINTLIDGVNQGYEVEDVVVAYCFTGPVLYEYTLRPNVDYVAVVYAIEYCDGLPQLVSKPCVKHFTTGN